MICFLRFDSDNIFYNHESVPLVEGTPLVHWPVVGRPDWDLSSISILIFCENVDLAWLSSLFFNGSVDSAEVAALFADLRSTADGMPAPKPESEPKPEVVFPKFIS